MSKAVKNRQTRPGFTLVELAVVIVIIGVLAAFGIPRFVNSAERSKAADAFSYLAAVREAQERYESREGTYAASVAKLDVKREAPRHFAAGRIEPGVSGEIDDSWTLTLTRTGASAGFGPYTVTFTQDGYDASSSTIDALRTINPLANDPNAGASPR